MDQPNLAVNCPRCKGPVAGIEKGYSEKGDEYEATRYTLIECPECGDPILVKHHSAPVLGIDDVSYPWSRPLIVYPPLEPSFGKDVPSKIARSYKEALRSFNHAAAYTGTAILCRRTLEGICAHFEAKGKYLHHKLKNLKETGKIDSRVYEWSNDVLKELGNDAAHDVDHIIGQQDAKHALDFTRAIIEYLFVFQASYERFKAEREQRMASKATKEKAEEPA